MDESDVVDTINVGSLWGDRYTDLQKKPIMFTYHLTNDEREKYEQTGFARLPNLTTYLKKKFGGLDNFDLIFFKDFENNEDSIIIQETSKPAKVFIDIIEFQKYNKTIQPLINKKPRHSEVLKKRYRMLSNDYAFSFSSAAV